jgi:hypothetical protein
VNFPSGVEPPKTFKLDIDATKQELYDDWNHSRDKYGVLTSVQLEKLLRKKG